MSVAAIVVGGVVALAVLGLLGVALALVVAAGKRETAAIIAAADERVRVAVSDGRVEAATVQIDLARQALAIAVADGDRQEARANALEEEISELISGPVDLVSGAGGLARLQTHLRTVGTRTAVAVGPDRASGDGDRSDVPRDAAAAGAAPGAGDLPISTPG